MGAVSKKGDSVEPSKSRRLSRDARVSRASSPVSRVMSIESNALAGEVAELLMAGRGIVQSSLKFNVNVNGAMNEQTSSRGYSSEGNVLNPS